MNFLHERIGWIAAMAIGMLLLAAPGRAQMDAASSLAQLKVADGLEVTLFAAEPDLINPTSMDIDAMGRVWITEAANYRLFKNPLAREQGDRIRVLEDTDGDGRSDKAWTFYQDPSLQSPMGIAVLGDRVYICQSPEIFYLQDLDGDGRADKKTVVLSGFGGVDHDHAIHGIMFGPDGLLYMTNGDEGLDVTDKSGRRLHVGREGDYRAATVLRMDPDGHHLELLAEGLRNPYEPTVDSFGTVFSSDNDDDGNEQCRICYVMRGGNYGYWPRRSGNRRLDEVHWNVDQPGVVPKIIGTGFGSPTGLLFYEGRLLPERFQRMMIHADAGPGVVRAYPIEALGAGYEGRIETVLETTTDRWMRPSDVTVAPDGSLFVSDWYDRNVGGHNLVDFTRGRIFRIAPPGARYRVQAPDLATAEGVADALASPNLATRFLAHEAFGKGDVEGLDEILQGYFRGDDPVMAARALWLLAPRGEAGLRALLETAGHRDAQFRVLAVRVAAGMGPEHLRRLEALVRDPDPAVRREMLLELARIEEPWAHDWITELALLFDGSDRFYREAIGIAARGRESQVFAEVSRRVGDESDPRVSALALQLHTPEAYAKAKSILESAERAPEARINAVKIVAAVGGEESAAFLTRHLPDESDRSVQLAILDSLSALDSDWDEKIGEEALDTFVRSALDDPESRVAMLEFIGDKRLGGFVPDLMAVAENQNLDTGERLAALDSLAEIGRWRWRSTEREAMEGIDRLLADRNADISLAALGVVGYFRSDGAQQVMRSMLADTDRPHALRREAVRLLGRSRSGSLLLLDLAERDDLPTDLLFDAGQIAAASPYENIRLMGERFLPQDTTRGGEPLPSMDVLLAMKGDAARGREVFYSEQASQCYRCHQIDGQGEDVGPDLSAIGAKLGRDGLAEAILNPSAAISHEYEVWIVRTRDRGYLSGYIANETPQGLELMDSAGKAISIEKKDVIERRMSDVSLMPTGLSSGMTAQELVNLIEYLSTLKSDAANAGSGSGS